MIAALKAEIDKDIDKHKKARGKISSLHQETVKISQQIEEVCESLTRMEELECNEASYQEILMNIECVNETGSQKNKVTRENDGILAYLTYPDYKQKVVAEKVEGDYAVDDKVLDMKWVLDKAKVKGLMKIVESRGKAHKTFQK